MAKWLSQRLGALYAELYRKFGPETFTSSDVAELLRDDGAARMALVRMREAGAVYVHEKKPRSWLYRLADPETYLLSVAGIIRNLEKIPQQRYSRLIGIFGNEAIKRNIGIKSIVLFGSVARGNAGQDSDVDLLIISDAFRSLGEALDKLVDLEYSSRVAQEMEWLENNGVSTHLSFHPLSSRMLQAHPPIVLDIVDEGITIVDDGTYKMEAMKIMRRMRELGAKRIWLAENEWVWILKPDAKIGEVIEI
ncbi:MAG: nucleotidyltransferase domain-containing protein [Nitrososphaerota archaeon]